MDKILVAQISLHYEQRPTIIHEWTRERYQCAIDERKHDRSMQDWYYKRVTESAANKILEAQAWDNARENYSKAIQKKYNVGPNWENNRWFMEQVRPTLY